MSRAVDRDRLELTVGLRRCERGRPAGGSRSRPLVYRHVWSRYRTVHLVFDIFRGIGAAAAVGIRPFLPALAVAALAGAKAEIHFKHTDYSFLLSLPFLL